MPAYICSPMASDQALPLSVRLRVVSAVIVGYLAALAPLLLFGPEGGWWFGVLLLGSTPLLAFAGLAAFFFAESIRRRPVLWASSAGIIALAASLITLRLLTRTWTGVLAAPTAVLAPLAFLYFLRVFKVAAPPEELSES